MKITFIDDEPEIWPMQYGGKARTIVTLAEALVNKPEIKSVEIISRSINSLKDNFTSNGVKYIKTDNYDTIGKIIRAVDESDIVSVHTCSFTFPNVEGMKAKIVYNLHDVIFATSDAGSHLDKALSGKWDVIISPSDYASNVLANISYWNNLKENIVTVPRGLNIENFQPIDKSEALKMLQKNGYLNNINVGDYPIILFPSRPEVSKGLKHLHDLFNGIKKIHKDIKLIITSDPGDLKSKNVIYSGWVPTHLLKYLYSLSDLVVNFSLLPESFSQVSIESIACGTPVLCFKFGNLSHLSDQIPAIYGCAPETSEILNLTENILKNTKENQSKISYSINFVKKEYNLSKIVNQYLETYHTIIGGKPVSFKLNLEVGHKEPRYFISPLISKYDNKIYLADKNGNLRKFVLDLWDQVILDTCQCTCSLESMLHIAKCNKNILQNKLDYLVLNKIIIRV